MAMGAAGWRSGQWILIWPMLAFAFVSVAYFTGRSSIFGKNANGERRLWAMFVLLPYLIFAELVWRLQTALSREPAWNEVNPFLVVSRRLRLREFPRDVTRICDLTCEFTDPGSVRSGRDYCSIPILDAGTMGAADLINAAKSLPPDIERKLLIHCANGHGRTGMFAAVWLLVHQFAKNPDEAISILTTARPGIALRRRQREAVVDTFRMLTRLAANDGANHD